MRVATAITKIMIVIAMHRSPLRRRVSGFSLAETIVSVAVAAITLTGIMMLNSQALKMVWASRQTNAATLCLQERIEQLRIANWRQITDSNYLQTNFFATVPMSAAPLDQMKETISVTAYPDPTVAGAICVERSSAGVQVVSTDSTLAELPLARVDLEVAWIGDRGRNRIRESSTIISKGGISKLNLAMTGGGATTGPSPTPAASATPNPSATPTPSGSATPTPTPSATPTPTPANNGNGNGRGNVGGQSGKK